MKRSSWFAAFLCTAALAAFATLAPNVRAFGFEEDGACCPDSQCTAFSQCFDSGYCLQGNKCVIDGSKCKWVSCA
jgi:hypothetical protein